MARRSHAPIPILPDALARRFWLKVNKSAGPDACWPWKAGTRKKAGYGGFKVYGLNITASRIAYALHRHKDPGDMLVCHTCDNPPCCNPKHLFLGTVKDNSDDMVRKGRHRPPISKGDRNGNAKLTQAQVTLIKEQIAAGKTNTSIALLFDITHQLISRIRRGKAWGGEPLTKKYESLKRGT